MRSAAVQGDKLNFDLGYEEKMQIFEFIKKYRSSNS